VLEPLPLLDAAPLLEPLPLLDATPLLGPLPLLDATPLLGPLPLLDVAPLLLAPPPSLAPAGELLSEQAPDSMATVGTTKRNREEIS
jgi:hypothetical protein